MKRFKNIKERFIESIFTVSGALTSIVILLIVIFLFKEGLGLFNAPSVEEGYQLVVHADNPIEELSVNEIKQIFDSEITLWSELNGIDEEIRIFRFDEIFNMYAESEFGEDYEWLP